MYKKLKSGDLGLLTLGAVTTILSTLMLVYLVASTEVSYVLGTAQPSNITVCNTKILLFKEKISVIKLSGLGFIIVGLLLLNKAKHQK